jgi:predicted amidophosphoribosyltransferase
VTPSNENGVGCGPVVNAAETLRCARCGAEWGDGTQRCGACQSFLMGNQTARRSGAYARQHPPDLRMSAEELGGRHRR